MLNKRKDLLLKMIQTKEDSQNINAADTEYMKKRTEEIKAESRVKEK